MAGITNVDFSEYEITELGIRISPAVKADILKCVGKLEEELTSKTVQKKCGSKVIKTRTKGTGSGSLKFSAYTPQDMLVDMHGMSRKDLKDGIVAYGQSSLHAVACVTAKILNEDGDVKYKAYPNCTITNGLSRTVDNDTEDVAMLQSGCEPSSMCRRRRKPRQNSTPPVRAGRWQHRKKSVLLRS